MRSASQVMQVHYRGEGGIFALLAGLMPLAVKGVFTPLTFLTLVAIVGGATLFGDGNHHAGDLRPFRRRGSERVVAGGNEVGSPDHGRHPDRTVQHSMAGTEKVGFVFCPVMELWFLAIAIAGGAVITAHPQILAALDPFRASGFITHHELGSA